MYAYEPHDQRIVDDRVEQFRDQTQRYLDGDLSDAEFLPLRLRNGLYVQRLAPMLRVAVPYGTLAPAQLRRLAHVARHYDKGYGHLSTRQNVQFNWPRLEEVPDILAELAEVQMHAIQTSGNCIRNVTTDQFAGAAADEHVDPRVWCELIRQWSTDHPEFDWLPRKFKIAVSGAGSDRAATAVHDIGLAASPDGAGGACFDVSVGGGLGRTPVIGHVIRRNLPQEHLLTYLEAILRVYNRYGRRDNKYKARIKILVRAMGPEGFRDRVEAEWAHLRDGPGRLEPAEVQRVAGRFRTPDLEPVPEPGATLDAARAADPAFDRWVRHNVIAHRVSGHRIVTLSCKRTGIAPGDVSDEQMDAVADWAERFGHDEIRISHEQNLVLPHVRAADLHALWTLAVPMGLGEPSAGTLHDIICCPGGDFCSLANAKSIPVAEAVQRRLADADLLDDVGALRLNISGCMNACGHHHVGHVGILGVDKKGAEFYQVSLGGHDGSDGRPASLGRILGPAFAQEDVPEVVATLVEVYRSRRRAGEDFLACLDRIGIEPFREQVYA